MRNFFYFIHWWILLLPDVVIAQEYLVDIEYLDMEDGLSNRFAKAIYQDSKGFIWISTGSGLNRFDGHNFKVYDKQKAGLWSDQIEFVTEDIFGNIWIIYSPKRIKTYLNHFSLHHLIVEVLNPNTGVVQKLEEKYPAIASISDQQITTVRRDHRRRIWIGTYEGGVYCFDGVLREKLPKNQHSFIRQILPNKDDTFWILNGAQLEEIDSAGCVGSSDPVDFFVSNEIMADESGTLWLDASYMRQGEYYTQTYFKERGKPLQVFAIRESRSARPRSLITSWYHFVYPLPSGELFYLKHTESQEIVLYDKQGLKMMAIPIVKLNEIGHLSAGIWRTVLVDNSGSIWICTVDGVIRMSISKNPFQQYLVAENAESTRGIAQISKNRIWVNTHEGWRIIDLELKRVVTRFDARQKGMKNFYYNQGYGAICVDGKYMLLGAYGMGFFTFDLKTQVSRFSDIEGDEGEGVPFYSNRVRKVLLGTKQGLYYFDAARHTILPFESANGNKFLDNRIFSISEDEEGIWLATDDGLLVLDEKQGIKARYHHFPDNQIVHMHRDGRGIFWLATRNGGLLEWDRKINRIRQYTKEEGLSDNTIYAVYEDGKGRLWLPSNFGLMCFDKETHQVTTYMPRDGITHEEFNFTAHCRLDDGRLAFGGLNGMIVFHPDSIVSKAYSVPVLLTSYEEMDPVTGEMIEKTDDLLRNGSIRLEHAVKSFYLKFALMDFNHPDQHRYSYRIEEYDQNWNAIEGRYLRVNKLPAGRYRLRIRGQGSFGRWSDQELVLPIFVAKPFYLQLWFIGLCILTIAGGVSGFIYWRIANLRASERRLAAEVKARTKQLEILNQTKDKLFSIIGHELRGPLIYFQGIAQNLDYLLKKGDWQRARKIGENLQSSAKGIAHILDNLLYWGLTQSDRLPHRPDWIAPAGIAAQTIEFLEDVAREKEITLVNHIPDHFRVYADERALFIIFRNLLDNAVKFTPKGGVITFCAKMLDDTVSLGIMDTGPGITEQQIQSLYNRMISSGVGTRGEKGVGLGLILCRELAEKNGGQLKIENQEEGGAIVRIFLPANPPLNAKTNTEKIDLFER